MPRALPFCGLLTFLVFYSPHVAAQATTSGSTSMVARTRNISGQVVAQGTLVGVIRVTVESHAREFVRTVFTDSAGVYSVSGVPVGDYTFTIEAEGYQTLHERVDIYPGSGIMITQHFLKPLPAKNASPESKQPSVAVAMLQMPPAARSEFEAGRRDLERRRYKSARGHFEKALEKHAAFPHALHALAMLDQIEQQFDRALEHLHRAIQIDHAFFDAQLALSRLDNRQGRHAEALESAREAVRVKPDNWEAHYELGLAALSLGQPDLALESAARIESLAGPRNPEFRLLRAGVRLRRAEYAEAKSDLDAFLQVAPDHSMAELARRILHEVEGKLSLATPN